MPDHNNIAIETHALCKQIPLHSANDLNILDSINLHIPHNSSVAITGASGSGKTTLLGLLAGLDSPSTGKIHLLGQEISAFDEDQRAALRLGKVGFVFQSFHLMDNLTALENVMLPLELNTGRAIDSIDRAARTALQDVGLADRIDHLPNQLSGGEQQRVALARAFVNRPAVLFADEPTGNLDSNTAQEIINLLFSLQQRYQSTLVLVTHDEALAQRCQQHYRLVNGRLQTGERAGEPVGKQQ
jgi:putative ABC transport system ATP-binding protein